MGASATGARAAVKPAAATIDRWWQDLSAHQQMDGGCPKCGTRGRCRPWAEAFSELVAHDLLLPHAAMPAASPPPAEPPHYDHRDGFTMHRPDPGARDNRAFWEAANRVTIPEQASHLNGLLDQVLRYLRADTVMRSVDFDSDLDRLPSSPTR